MTARDLIKLLVHGELKNLSYVDNTTGFVKPEKLDRVLDTINLGLTDLYTRFYLNRKPVEIEIVKGKHEYTVDDVDLIEITSIGLDKDKYLMKDLKTIYLYETNIDKLDVTCKLNHPKVTVDSEIMLPTSYLNALVLFVASRLYTSMPNQLDGDLNEHTRYLQRYIEEIRHLTDTGLDVDDLDDICLFYKKGFI